jgi:hypothetical protein
VRVDIALNEFSGINLIWSPGRRVGVTYEKFGEYLDTGAFSFSWYGSVLLERMFTNLAGWDLSIQGGKVYGGHQIGGGFSGELGPVEVRGEIAYFAAKKSETLLRFEQYDYLPLGKEPELFDHLSSVVGLGHHFDNTLTIEAEYLFNGLGTDSTDAIDLFASTLRVGLGDSFHLGRHLLGVMVGYNILPILNGSLAWIFSAVDGSSLLQPGFIFSVADEVDFLFGAMIGLGARPKEPMLFDLGQKSEFGTYPNIYYMEFKFYF